MLALVAAALIAAPAPPSVDDLVARHRRALGRLVSTTARWNGTITRDAFTEHYEVTADYTGRYRETWTSTLGARAEGSDGKNDWTQDENGDVEATPTKHAFSFEFALVRLNDFRIDPRTQNSIGELVDVGGRKAYPLAIKDAGHTITLYVDAATALLDGADVGSHTVRYRNYKTYDGTPVPTLIEESGEGSTVTRTVDSVAFGVAVAGVFELPIMREPAFPTGVSEVTTNFEAVHGLMIVQATVNDKPVRMLLDSGSSTSVLDVDVAKRLGLATAGAVRLEAAGELSGTNARIDRFGIAGITIAPFVVEAVPLKLPPLLARANIDGVLGYDFLDHVVLRIAYLERELRLTKPSAFTYKGTGAVITVDASDRVPRIEASLGDGDKGTFTIDTGSDEGLVLYLEFANAHPRDFVDPMEFSMQSASGAGGDFATRSAVVKQFNLGIFTVNSVSAEVILRPTGAFSPGQSDGLIGAKVLERFRAVFLDYAGKRFILEN